MKQGHHGGMQLDEIVAERHDGDGCGGGANRLSRAVLLTDEATMFTGK
jgi:hypothetical protein